MSTATDCYITSEYSATFLRFETCRERLALPYATLLGLSLSVDETVLEFDFASHRVKVTGKRLYEIFCAVAAGKGQALLAQSEIDVVMNGPSATAPAILNIHIQQAAQSAE